MRYNQLYELVNNKSVCKDSLLVSLLDLGLGCLMPL